jgi:peptide/nickel transport system substrate-binding protein
VLRDRSPVAAGLLCLVLVGGAGKEAAAQPKPEGEMRWALYVTLSPMWFDPGEFAGLTPFWVLYAIHDAMVKPMPGNLMTPSLAESWTVSADQRVYEFKLREGVKFTTAIRSPPRTCGSASTAPRDRRSSTTRSAR